MKTMQKKMDQFTNQKITLVERQKDYFYPDTLADRKLLKENSNWDGLRIAIGKIDEILKQVGQNNFWLETIIEE